jgi:hypothetical protein
MHPLQSINQCTMAENSNRRNAALRTFPNRNVRKCFPSVNVNVLLRAKIHEHTPKKKSFPNLSAADNIYL